MGMGTVWRGAAPAPMDEGTESHSAPGAGMGAGTSAVLGAGYLGAVEVAAVRAREPARPAGALVDAHVPQLDVHPHDAPVQGDGVSPGTLGSCGDAAAGGLGDGAQTRGTHSWCRTSPLGDGSGGFRAGARTADGAGEQCGAGTCKYTRTRVHTCTNTPVHTHVHTPALTSPLMCTCRETRSDPGAAGTRCGEESCPAPRTLHPTPCCTQLVPHAWGRCLPHPSPPWGTPQPPAPRQAPCTPSPPAPLT